MTANGTKDYTVARRSSSAKENLDLGDSGVVAEGSLVPMRWGDISDPRLEGFVSSHF